MRTTEIRVQSAPWNAAIEVLIHDRTTQAATGSGMGVATVAGRRCDRSNADMERACLVLLTEEQEKGDFSNSALVATLADMVRLIREYTDTMNSPNDQAQR